MREGSLDDCLLITSIAAELSVRKMMRRLASRGAHVRIARKMGRSSLDEIWTGDHEEGKEPWIQEV